MFRCAVNLFKLKTFAELDGLDESKPTLWLAPLASVASIWNPSLRWWLPIQLGIGLVIVGLAGPVLFGGGKFSLLLDLAAPLGEYGGLFCLNNAALMLLAFCLNFVFYAAAKSSAHKTFFTVLTQAGMPENLRDLTGLYTDGERLKLWRLTLAAHYFTYALSLPTAAGLWILNGYLVFAAPCYSYGIFRCWLLKFFWMFPVLVCGANSAAMGVYVEWFIALQIYFFVYRIKCMARYVEKLTLTKTLESDLSHLTIFLSQLKKVLTDFSIIRLEFRTQKIWIFHAVGQCWLASCVTILFWIYFLSYLVNDWKQLLGTVTLMGGCLHVLLTIGWAARQLPLACDKFTRRLYSVAARLPPPLPETNVRLRILLLGTRKMLLAEICRNDSEPLLVQCWSWFSLTGETLLGSYLEIASSYLLFVATLGIPTRN